MARPADVEAALVAYLKPLFPEVPVGTRVPSPRPARFVRLFVIGGTRRNLGQQGALMFVEAWGSSEGDASDLAADVWEAIDAADGKFLASGVWLADVEGGLATPVSNSDPESGQDRYTFTANLTVNLQESA